MQRKKTLKLVITFPTTTSAMNMDAICSSEFGRLIPIPREISAGCGLAWCSEPKNKTHLLQMMQDHDIPYQETQLLTLY